MFRKMRRIKQQLPNEECIKILEEEPRGILSVLGDNGYPYGMPMDYVYNDGKIIFHSALEGHTSDSIKNYDKVSFCVLNKGQKVENDWYYIFKSVIVFGRIKEVTDEEERLQKLRILGNKYFPSEEYTEDEINKFFERTLVLEIEIEHLTGKIVTEK